MTQPLWYSLETSYKAEHTLNIRYSNHAPWYLPTMIENLYTYNQHMGVYSSFIYNCQYLEATKRSFSRLMDKLWYIQTIEYYLI